MQREKFSFVAWFDDYFLLIASVFLLFFIPLWPKIPLADIIPGYIVRLRLEDIFVFATFIVYLIQVARGRVSWRMPTWQLIFGYVAVGLMSILTGIFVIHTIPFVLPEAGSLGDMIAASVHVAKSFLHWARYIEYFFLAFLFFSSLRQRVTLKVIGACMLLTVMAITIYGWGQKYLYWPVYSTMNREFAKGMKLVLTPHARVQSTFGGHYDFAAYLVLLLPFTLMIAKKARYIWPKYPRLLTGLAWLAHFMGVWGLIISAARTSIISYLVATVLLFTLDVALSARSRRGKVSAWFGHQMAYFALVGVLVFGWGQDMIERFEHTLDSIPWVHDAYHTANRWRKELPYMLGWKEWEQPEGTVAVVIDDFGNNSVLTPTDTQPEPVAPPSPTSESRPVDVYEDIPDIKVAVDASGNAYTYEATRTWSVNAEKYGFSMAIRFDTLWPNAIRGFSRNPLLGSGYGTLTKGESLSVFTEADSTDCNYLRTLGETGLLGFVCFYGAIIWAVIVAWRQRRVADSLVQMINLAYLGAAVGILVNALYIDVFAASKVAFTFWTLTGIFWAAQQKAISAIEITQDEKKVDA